jgi:membrane-associated phospholipid phosphatase
MELGEGTSDRLAELFRGIKGRLRDLVATGCNSRPFAAGDGRTLPRVSDDHHVSDVACLLLELSPCCFHGRFASANRPTGKLVEEAIGSRTILASKDHVLQDRQGHDRDGIGSNEQIPIDLGAVGHAIDVGDDLHPSTRAWPLGNQLPRIDTALRRHGRDTPRDWRSHATFPICSPMSQMERSDHTTTRRPRSLLPVRRARFKVTALTCLLATAALAVAVAHGHSPYAFEHSVLDWLGPPSALRAWATLAELLAVPVVSVVLVVTFAVGLVKRAVLRVAAYAVLGAAALLISEHVAKPLVQRTYYGDLTFPSGHVTAACATSLAMWLALYPLLGKRARNITLVLGVAWTLLMSLAVVGAHWHTPLDAVGSILLSVGIVTAGAAILEPIGTRGLFRGAERAGVRDRRGG